MALKANKLLADMINAGNAIAGFTAARTRDDYATDLMLRSAVERQFEILGEALKRLSLLDSGIAGRISDHQRIIAFRNVIAHGYDTLDADIVWQAVSEKLPFLVEEARALLVELDGSLP